MRTTIRVAVASLLLALLAGCALPPESLDPSTAMGQTSSSSTPSSSESVSTNRPSPTSSRETPPAPSPTHSTSPSSPANDPSAKVGVIITWTDSHTDSIDVAATVPDIVEQGGTCKAVATNGTTSLSATSSAFADPQSTTCNPMTVKGIGPGEWTITVTYTSSARILVSPPTKVSV